MDDWFRAPSQEANGQGWSARLNFHSRWIRTVIAARSRDAAAIEEIYQEVALAVAKQKAEIPVEKVAPWLYRIAVRQALLHRRRLGRQRKLQNNLLRQSNDDGDTKSDPLAWLLSDERQRLVRRAIEQLNAKDAELLMLKYTEDWSYRDLAEHLGVSQSAIETRLFRARQRLRMELVALEVVEAES